MVEAFDYKEEKAEKKSINPVKSKNYKKLALNTCYIRTKIVLLYQVL